MCELAARSLCMPVYVPQHPATTLGFYHLAASTQHHQAPPTLSNRASAHCQAIRDTFGRYWDHFARRALFPLNQPLQHRGACLPVPYNP